MGHSYGGDLFIEGVSVDSRHVKANDLFFALPGEQTDGHAYLQAAKEAGAIAAVVLNSYEGDSFGLELIRSHDVLDSLQKLAKTYLAQMGVTVIGITGSIGKTTTKEFLATMLSQKYSIAASTGNRNSQIGLPLTILNDIDENVEVLILEMAMDLPLQIANLVKIAPPMIALVTYVTLVHVCNFGSLEKIAKAKAEIFSSDKTEAAFYHLESDYGKQLSRNCKCRSITFSLSAKEADLTLEGCCLTSIFASGELAPLNVYGTHHRHNLLAAVAIAQYMGLSIEEINLGIANLTLPERRGQLIDIEGIFFVNDAYNATESSVKAALDALLTLNTKGKRFAVLSDMRELGQFSKECHRQVALHALRCVDEIFCYGEEVKHIVDIWQEAKRPITWCQNSSEVATLLKRIIKPSDVVLLKGSRSMQTWKVLDDFKQKI